MRKDQFFVNTYLLDKKALSTKILDNRLLHALYNRCPGGVRKLLTAVKYRVVVPLILFPRHARYAYAIANSGLFWDTYYCKHQVDVSSSPLSALRHFINFGWAEKRDPNPYFCTWWYLESNPDVERSGINPLYHYVKYGWREGRDPGPYFSIAKYRVLNPRIGDCEPLSHFLNSGIFDGSMATEFPPYSEYSIKNVLKKNAG